MSDWFSCEARVRMPACQVDVVRICYLRKERTLRDYLWSRSGSVLQNMISSLATRLRGILLYFAHWMGRYVRQKEAAAAEVGDGYVTFDDERRR